VVDGIRQYARGCGYAIGEHGTKVRDLDLIACPWVEWAIDPYDFVRGMCVALGMHVCNEPMEEEKPHGRLGWILVAFPEWREGDEYLPPRMIDFSVMPRH
jgi:hypothetical protein